MEKEADGGGDGDKRLLKLLGDRTSDKAFDIGASSGVEVLFQLSRCGEREEAETEGKRQKEYKIEVTHVIL